MTSGEPTAPKPSPRQGARGAKKPGRGGAAPSSTGTKEPRVSVSKAGASASRRGGRSSAAPSDDVLERLARLDTAPPATSDEVVLPPIVEADPAAGTARPVDQGGDAATVEPAAPVSSEPVAVPVAVPVAPSEPAPAPEPTESAPLVLTAASPATLPSNTVVSVDLPTAAVAAPAAADTAVRDALGAVVAPEGFAPAVEPVAVPLVPIEPAIPDVLPVLPVPSGPDTAVADVASAAEPGADGEGTGSSTLPLRRLRPPVVFRRAKPRVRRVTRVVRHVDTWSVFKVALVFNVILYLVCLTAGVLLWNVAHATGTIDNIEQFFEQFGWESFEFKGGEIYHNAWIGGLFVSIGLTGFAVLVATLFNLITDLVGGLRVTVLEEEVVARPRQGSDPTGGTTRP